MWLLGEDPLIRRIPDPTRILDCSNWKQSISKQESSFSLSVFNEELTRHLVIDNSHLFQGTIPARYIDNNKHASESEPCDDA